MIITDYELVWGSESWSGKPTLVACEYPVLPFEWGNRSLYKWIDVTSLGPLRICRVSVWLLPELVRWWL